MQNEIVLSGAQMRRTHKDRINLFLFRSLQTVNRFNRRQIQFKKIQKRVQDDAINSIDGIISSIEIIFNGNIIRIIPELFTFSYNFECELHVLAFAFQHVELPIQMRASIAFNELVKLSRIVIVAKIQQLS